MFICESPSLNEAFVSCFFLLFAGCCFVTFYTRKAALKAQDALHNIKTLVGVCKEYVVLFLNFDYIYIIQTYMYNLCLPFEYSEMKYCTMQFTFIILFVNFN